MTGLDLLFDPGVIPASCHKALPEGFSLRPLASCDIGRGHLEVLSVLTVTPKLTESHYRDTFRALQRAGTYFTIVIISNDQVVGCGTLITERKFVRGAGLVGHIEDIAVSKAMQGKKLGLRIINTLNEIGSALGCYKIILDCSKDNIAFYERCGFKQKEYQMVKYLDPLLARL